MVNASRLLRGFGSTAAVLLLAAGCGSSADSEGSTAGAAGAAGTGGVAGGGPTATAIEFEQDATLTVLPGERRVLAVRATPAGQHLVRFALLGDPRNASLDRSEATTDDDGRATIQLTAPTEPTTFSLRASVGTSVSAKQAVSVSASGFGTVQVIPQYSGKRSVSYWVGSVVTGTTCADLVGTPPPDGDLTNTALAEQAPRIENVPVGPVLAVTVRAGHFAGGCKDVEGISPDSISQVTVSVVDRPIQLDETHLDFALGVDQTGPEWAPTIEGAVASVTDALVQGGENDVATLLDAMLLEAPATTDQAAFAAARSLGGWDDAMGGQMQAGTLRTLASSWITAGMEGFTGAETFKGTLTSAGKQGAQAVFDLDTVLGLPAREAGFAEMNAGLVLEAEPGDGVSLGGTLYWLPSRLLTAAARGPALDAARNATDVPHALAEVIGCEGIGQILATGGTAPGVAFDACDADCVEALCTDALVTLWRRAEDASASSSTIGTLDVTAAVLATVDDEARPTAFSGSWVGALDVGFASVSVGGPATGETPQPK